MPFKSFDSLSPYRQYKPFFSDWIEERTDAEKKKLNGKLFQATEVRTTSKKGYFVDCSDFTVFIFKSHPLANIIKGYVNGLEITEIPTIQIDMTSKWKHIVGMNDFEGTLLEIENGWMFQPKK